MVSHGAGGGRPFLWDARCRTPLATDPGGGAETRFVLPRKNGCRPYLVLLPVGFALPPPLPGARCALTAPFHPYLTPERSGDRRFTFCGTFPGVAPAGRYPAPCFRGARTFLPPGKARRAAVQPSGAARTINRADAAVTGRSGGGGFFSKVPRRSAPLPPSGAVGCSVIRRVCRFRPGKCPCFQAADRSATWNPRRDVLRRSWERHRRYCPVPRCRSSR
ncbi:hypothetical protein SAMN04244559_01705 [Magnetospirillum fulvum]|uniref:Uncharacterized protein n=1 Tax=Magnetospirillum fulvum TaxID=1082 RepID=A0A1H6HH21_MAGFU|nr:hypothetical protein SAMN04244559_01705 [Magnetospirillum fulvum]